MQFEYPDEGLIVEEIEEIDNVVFIMKFYNMGDLLDNLVDGKLTDPDKKHIAACVVNGVMNIHKNGYLHRDIKFENIFLNRVNDNGKEKLEVAIGDFGLAC